MLVYVQWVMRDAAPWVPLNVTNENVVRALPKKGEPRLTGRTLNNQPGWINAWNCQGVTGEGWDHVAFQHDDATDLLTVSCWNDDPVDWPVGTRWAYVWTFLPLAPDHSLPGDMKGILNTRQTITMYAEDGFDGPRPPGSRPYSEFVVPPADLTFHGAWMSDTAFSDHRNARAHHEWMEWGDG